MSTIREQVLIAHVKALCDLQMILTLRCTSSPPCRVPIALPAVAQEGLGSRFRVQSVSAAHGVGAAEHTVGERLVI